MKTLLKLFIIVALVSLSACKVGEKVPYLVDAETIPEEVLSQSQTVADPVLMPGDLLNIEVTAYNMASVISFNKGYYVDDEGNIARLNNTYNSYNQTEISTDYYLIDADGDIEFPVLGKIHAAGLTKEQLISEIKTRIHPRYVTEEPSVDIRLMNFRVTVTGAVRNPGVYQSKNERMTFLEAIAMAGDLDIRGERENILLYRTNADGTRSVHRLNIHDKNFLTSPYFNLQQNDFIYVAPNKTLANSSWSLSPSITAAITVFGGLSSVASLVIGIINLTQD